MNDGTFVEIEFIGKVKDTGEVFDLTNAEDAKKAGVFNEKQKYGPVLVIIGGKSIVPGVEEEIKKMKAGEEKEFAVPVDKGFGKRNVKLIQVAPISKFYEHKVNPVPGAFVNIDGRDCRIQSVSGGRVRVDFNHPLAGKDLLYKIKVLRELEKPKDKLDSLINYYGLEAETTVDGEKAKIKLKNSNPMLEQLVSASAKKWVKEIKEIEFEKQLTEAKKEEEHGHEDGKN